MFIQALLLITIDNFWLNWSRTKNRLKEFVEIIEAVNNSPVKRSSLDRSLLPVQPVDDDDAAAKEVVDQDVEAGVKEEDKKEEKEETTETLQMALATLVSAVNPVKKHEAEEALRLNEHLRAFIQSRQRSTLLSYAYKLKTGLRLLACVGFSIVSVYYIMREDFDFDFPCDLENLVINETLSLPIGAFYCVNVTAMFSKMLVDGYLIAIILNIVVCVVALGRWHTGQKALPTVLTQYGETVGTNCMDSMASLPTYNDAIFLLYLLQQANSVVFNDVLDFATIDFHHELLHYLSNVCWPLGKLKSLVKPPPAMQSLKLADSNLIMVPPAVRHMTSLVEIDLSTNADLFDVSNLCGLKGLKYLILRCCNLRSIAGLMNLESLVKLDVTNNKVTEIPDEIVHLKQLSYLYIRMNPLQSIPAQVIEDSQLKYLEVEEMLVEAFLKECGVFEPHPFIRSAFVRREAMVGMVEVGAEEVEEIERPEVPEVA